MSRSRESEHVRLQAAIVEKAVSLAPKYDAERNGHIWQALKEVGISKDEQAEWFGRVKREVDRRVTLQQEVRAIRSVERATRHQVESQAHERAMDPKAHDRDDYPDVA